VLPAKTSTPTVTALRAAEQGYHHPSVTAFAIAIIAERDGITLGVGTLNLNSEVELR